MKKLLSMTAACLMFLCGCGEEPADDTVSTVFHSMEQCLIGIRTKSGSELQIYHETPGHVVGKLAATGLAFACEQKTTGNDYVIFEGWYIVDPPSA